MKSKNMVFIALSLDGYIADRNGGLDWLTSVPNPDGLDMGYDRFIREVDALVMGRRTFETVCSFDMEWPYHKPVFVLSSTLKSLPGELSGKAELILGTPGGILDQLHAKGYQRLYVDGGATIQQFLREDLIDELIITTIPVLLGGGTPLFGELLERMEFELEESLVFLDALVQNRYRRKR